MDMYGFIMALYFDVVTENMTLWCLVGGRITIRGNDSNNWYVCAICGQGCPYNLLFWLQCLI